MSSDETARALGISTSAVSQRLTRARWSTSSGFGNSPSTWLRRRNGRHHEDRGRPPRNRRSVGGKYVVSLIFRAAGVRAGGDTGLLRGGLWIGYLERLGIVIAILTSYPAGIAVILGVKTLARYAELKSQPTPGSDAAQANKESSAAIEQFIIGTMASALWSVLLTVTAKALWG